MGKVSRRANRGAAEAGLSKLLLTQRNEKLPFTTNHQLWKARVTNARQLSLQNLLLNVPLLKPALPLSFLQKQETVDAEGMNSRMVGEKHQPRARNVTFDV